VGGRHDGLLPQGNQHILLEPRGSRRLSSQSLLDMRLSKAIVSGESARIELLVDALNLLNMRRNQRLTICSVRISDVPPFSWTRVEP
jgi:hypothetical protein